MLEYNKTYNPIFKLPKLTNEQSITLQALVKLFGNPYVWK